MSDISVTVWDGTDDVLVEWEDVDALASDFWGFYRSQGGYAEHAVRSKPTLRQEAAGEARDSFLDWGPERAFAFVQAIVKAAPSRKALFFVGAGPLEDLVDRYGNELASLLVGEAKRSGRFRLALSGVWLSTEKPLNAETLTLLTPYLGDDETTPFD